MKSYWIVAVVIGGIAFASGTRAYVADSGLTGQAVQQPAPSEKSATGADGVKPQAGTEAAKPAPTEQSQSNTTATTQPAPAASAQPKNSYLLVELSKTLKANKLKPGDKIKAEIVQDVIAHGKIIIPIETKLEGHVTEVGVRAGDSGESRLGFVFDKILLKNFRDINFQGVIQAVSPPVIRKSRVDQG